MTGQKQSNGTELVVRESVHRDITMKATKKMQLYRLIYYSQSALHVSGDVFAHHQEHLIVFTASGSVNCNSKLAVTSIVLYMFQ